MDQTTGLVLVAAITAIGTAVPATLGVWVQGRAAKRDRAEIKAVVDETADRGRESRLNQESMRAVIDDTHLQVTAINGKTMAELADASETRRVAAILPADRNEAEAEHIAVVPPEDGP